MVDTLLLIGACICFALATLGVAANRIALVPLGLLLLTITFLTP